MRKATVSATKHRKPADFSWVPAAILILGKKGTMG